MRFFSGLSFADGVRPTASVELSARLAMLWASATRVRSLQYRPAAIVNLALLLELAVAALPPGAEDEIVLIEHLPGRRVHLQDFFWTGVEDAPSWLDPNQILTLYETRTIHHTVTVYVPEESPRTQNPYMELSQPIGCTSCIEPTPTSLGDVNQNIGILLGDDPGPRYWLLTVLKAGESVPSKVELRLAKLYKVAFSRQQQKHLGLLPEIQTRKNIPKREIIRQNHTMEIMKMTDPATTTESPRENSTFEERPLPRLSLLRMRAVRIAKNRRALPVPQPEDEVRNETRPQARKALDVGLVQVRMHNTSLTEAGATKLIYTVHLGGKPVPAETAAKDMSLLSPQEVALELGAPVLIQSEPYLKESRPLALSRKRDAWLFIGAAGAGLFVLLIVLVGLLLSTKRKRSQSNVAAPTSRRILVKDEEYATTIPGIDDTAYTSEAEARPEATSRHRRTTPGSLSTAPGSQDIIDVNSRNISTENDLENDQRRAQNHVKSWDTSEYAEITSVGVGGRRMQGGNTIDRSQSLDSMDSATTRGGNAHSETLNSLEKGFASKENEEEENEEEEAAGSPHSYLSMPSCKQFPNMNNVEPLSKVLESTTVKHLDMELESPEMKSREYDPIRENGDRNFSRASSAVKDPGVLGPIVWDLKRKRVVEGHITPAPADLESGHVFHGPVGRARRRLNELIEDSFNLFGSRESKHGRDQTHRMSDPPSTSQWQQFALLTENRGKSAQVSQVISSNFEDKSRPRTSLPRNDIEENILETGQMGPHPRGAWGSRPLSAGPFHRPSLPEVDVVRIHTDFQLHPEDPAVPLIAAIKRELGKFYE